MQDELEVALYSLAKLPEVKSLSFGRVRTDLYSGMPNRSQG